jgi:hypothetical protein
MMHLEFGMIDCDIFFHLLVRQPEVSTYLELSVSFPTDDQVHLVVPGFTFYLTFNHLIVLKQTWPLS